MDPTGITAAAQHMVHVTLLVGAVVLAGGLVAVALWGWITGGRGY